MDYFGRLTGIPWGEPDGAFLPLPVGEVTLYFLTNQDDLISPQYYAFRIADEDGDRAMTRMRAGGVEYYADPRRTMPGHVQYVEHRRRVLCATPGGHRIELPTA